MSLQQKKSNSRKIGGHVSIAGGLPNAIKNTLDIGGNCLQVFAGSPRTWKREPFKDDQVKSFNQEVEKQKLDPVFIHALYLVNLASDNQELLDKSYQALLMDLENGQKINSAGVIVHIGSHQGRGFDSAKSQIVKLIKKLLLNTKETPFIIENSAGQKGKVGSLDEIATLVKELNHPRVKVCLDSAHLFAAGYDLAKKKVVDTLVKDLEKKNLLKSLICLHLNDSKTPLGSTRDQHENIGKGEIGKVGLSNLINHPKLKHLPIILEVPGKDKSGPDKENILTVHTLSQ
jgi:deoxyribonuclease IV